MKIALLASLLTAGTDIIVTGAALKNHGAISLREDLPLNDNPPVDENAISICDDDSYCNDDADNNNDSALENLDKRGGKRKFSAAVAGNQFVDFESWSYPSRGKLFKDDSQNKVLRKVFNNKDINLRNMDVDGLVPPPNLNSYMTEHILELQTIKSFIHTAATGELPSGGRAVSPLVNKDFFTSDWNSPSIKVIEAGLGNIGQGSNNPSVPSQRIAESLGSDSNRHDFVLCDNGINSVKARLWSFENPVAEEKFTKLITTATDVHRPRPGNQPTQDDTNFLTYLREIISVFRYLQHPDIVSRLHDTMGTIETELNNIEKHVTGARAQGIVTMWKEFINDYLRTVEKKSQDWMKKHIADAKQSFDENVRKFPIGQAPPRYLTYGQEILDLYEKQIPTMTIP